MVITKDDIQKAINKLRPYKLYGTKENLDKVRGLLPYYVELIEFPECFFNEDMMDKLILTNAEDCMLEIYETNARHGGM